MGSLPSSLTRDSFYDVFLLHATAKPSSFTRNACELAGRTSPFIAVKEEGLHSSACCHQSHLFLSLSPKVILTFLFQTSSFSLFQAQFHRHVLLSISLLQQTCFSFSFPTISQHFSCLEVAITLPPVNGTVLFDSCLLISFTVQPYCFALLISPINFLNQFITFFIIRSDYMIHSFCFLWFTSDSFSQTRRAHFTISTFCLFIPFLLPLSFS